MKKKLQLCIAMLLAVLLGAGNASVLAAARPAQSLTGATPAAVRLQAAGGYFVRGGKKYYRRASGEVISRRGWFTRDDGVKAYANSGGVIKAGVVTSGSKLYYVNNEGVRRNGHFKGAAGRYYYTRFGVIYKGWNTWKGKQFYVNNSGWLVTGKQKIGSKTFTFSDTGVLYEKSKLTVMRNGKRVTDTAANILARVVMAEVGGFQKAEVYKAQAVAAHSYILYENSRNRAPSVPDKAPIPMVVQAVNEVADQYMAYNGAPILATYYASSNGRTNSSADFWSNSLPYLVSVDSRYDVQAEGYEVKTVITAAQFLKMMDRTYGEDNYRLPANPVNWIKAEYNAAGYAKGKVTLGNKKPSVEFFYQTIVGIRSPAFTVSYDKAADAFTFITRGWGHGVGMSQWGAYFFHTKQGWKYNQILSHYYPGAVLASV